MPAKTSKESSDRLKAARFVLSAFSQHGQEISDLLVERFRPDWQEGDPEPEFFGSLVAVSRQLKILIDQVIVADNRLFAANAALDGERALRGDKAFKLSRQIIGLRGACNSLFVDLPVQQLGFDFRTAQDPAPLLIQAERVAENLESGQFEAEYLFEEDDFDPRKYAIKVREQAKELRTCLDLVAELRRNADAALLHKQKVTEEYDGLFRDGARLFESYCRMAGRNDLADRLRPSVRRPGRTQQPPSEEESAAEAQIAGEPGVDASSDTKSAAVESAAVESAALALEDAPSRPRSGLPEVA